MVVTTVMIALTNCLKNAPIAEKYVNKGEVCECTPVEEKKRRFLYEKQKVVSLVPTASTTNVSTNITINGNTKTNTSTSTSAKGLTSWKTVRVINFSKGKPTWKY